MAIKTVKIFPSIGIARLGNSPAGFFIGPEIPGVRPVPPGGYKDSACRVKRQAARFRLFGFDAADTLVQEITQSDGEIAWTVHLANKKGAWKRFNGLNANGADRNSGVPRGSLEIDPGPRTLDGPNQAAGFNTGRFLGTAVPLGEMRTEATGRLLVFGGFGNSASLPPGKPLPDYANNDGWHDDVSDGPVTATVTIDGTTFNASPAWVICAPPDFAPAIDSITTLYDTLFQVAVAQGSLSLPATPSFTTHIWPILSRVLRLQRATQPAAAGHASFTAAFVGASAAQRAAIFSRLRNPNVPNAPGAADMPRLFDDSNGAHHTITKSQYALLQSWKDGVYADDWPGTPPAPPGMITPDDLTRAALEACVGAAFFPGIEASWMVRDTFAYSEPFRLNHAGMSAGDVTKQMAVPWQTDFYECLREESLGGLAWWPAQRPDDVFPEDGGGPVMWTRDIIRNSQDASLEASHQDMVANWSKLGFVVEQGGAFVEVQRSKVCRSCSMVTDHSSFSEDEVSAALLADIPAKFNEALYVIAEGFTPGELGVTSAAPNEAALATFAPSILIRRADNSLVPGLSAVAAQMLLQDPAMPANLRQRFTFVYRLEFANTNGFSANGMPIETQTAMATATKSAVTTTFTTTGELQLVHQPNPYMLDGATSWLSSDVRVFQITQGTTRFGKTIGGDASAARQFIKEVLEHFNTAAGAADFETVEVDQNSSRLELSAQVAGQRVFNFAVAKVRYRGLMLDAPDVRVSFRLFTTAATGVDFNSSSTYCTSTSPQRIALPGLQGGEIVTIPCFAAERVDSSVVAVDTQHDALNLRTLEHAGASEVTAFFGCWLDFNQTTPYYPNHPVPRNGPWAAGRKPIQELIRGLHQCLVAEVNCIGQPLAEGASPAASDKLAQRNLIIVASGNPGHPQTHTVVHTFEIAATHPQSRPVVEVAGAIAAQSVVRVPNAGPDELMIRWNDLPRGADMTLYMPEIDVDALLCTAAQLYETTRLERVDAHTLRCLPADVTYIPLPDGRTRNTAALLTIVLPDGVRHRQSFHVVVHQLSDRPRRVLGAFQVSIPVGEEQALLAPETRALSVLRHIQSSIPLEDPWHAIFARYVGAVADRVRGFGGDPDVVAPAADGSGIDTGARECTRRSAVVSLLTALLIVTLGWHPLAASFAENAIALALLVGLGIAIRNWYSYCKPSLCSSLRTAAVGISLGAALLAIVLLLTAWNVPLLGTLGFSAVIAAVLLIIAARGGCFGAARC